MKKSILKEIAKFASGLIIGDFLCGLWLYFSSLAPISFLGMTFTKRGIVLGMVFDIIVFAFLVHYAWKMGDRTRSDAERLFHNIAGTLFSTVALLHLSRIIFGLQLVIASWNVPYWLNGLGAVVTLFLAYISFELGRKE